LSQATIASTTALAVRPGLSQQTVEIAVAPSEWPTIPIRFGSTSEWSGLYGAFRPSATRRSWRALCTVPLVALGSGT
jgi:hypothetical protein